MDSQKTYIFESTDDFADVRSRTQRRPDSACIVQYGCDGIRFLVSIRHKLKRCPSKFWSEIVLGMKNMLGQAGNSLP